jgi:hypothetical protein
LGEGGDDRDLRLVLGEGEIVVDEIDPVAVAGAVDERDIDISKVDEFGIGPEQEFNSLFFGRVYPLRFLKVKQCLGGTSNNLRKGSEGKSQEKQ